jgi:hypothetical protein
MEIFRPRLTGDDLWTIRLALTEAIDVDIARIAQADSLERCADLYANILKNGLMYSRIRTVQGNREGGELRLGEWLATARKRSAHILPD